jgi:hypothetical protein
MENQNQTETIKPKPINAPFSVYLSGQITGLHIVEAKGNFERAEMEAIKLFSSVIGTNDRLRIVNPMKIDHNPNAEWEDYMEKDIAQLLRCRGIYMLTNWKYSKGARIEHAIALELGLPVIYQTPKP